jgi:hypothetical protein
MANVGVRVERFVRLGANALMACAADNLIRQLCCIDSLCSCLGLGLGCRPVGDAIDYSRGMFNLQRLGCVLVERLMAS